MSVNSMWIMLEPHEMLEDGCYGFYRHEAEEALRLNQPLDILYKWELEG